MFKRLLSWIRTVVNKMTGYSNIREVCDDSAVSSVMESNIDKWMEMYQGRAPWVSHDRHKLGLASQIAGEIAMLVTLEAEIKVTENNDRGKMIKKVMDQVRKKLKTQVEYGCAGGGLMFRPSVSNGKIVVNFSKANAFLPTSFDSDDNIRGADFIETQVVGKKYYTRVERHFYGEDGKYMIVNKAFRSYDKNNIGVECSLSECPAWRDIEPMIPLDYIDHPLFSYFRIPLGNTVDPDSPLGMSVYGDVVDLIQDADEQYQRLNWEYHGGELAIEASEEAFAVNKDTKMPKLPEHWERLYRMNDLDADSGADLMKPWAPTLRDASYINGLDEILTKIEDKVHLSRGTLCKRGETNARTAEEIKMTKQRSYATVSQIQGALEDALDGLIVAIDELITLYELAPDGEFEVSYVWDDSIIVDAEKERQRDRDEVDHGLMAKWEYRKKWYGETEEQAKAAVAANEPPSDDELLFGNEPK